MTVNEERGVVLTEATAWIGTPFANGAQLKHVGVDCAHLIVAAFASVVTVDVPKYPADWFLHSDRERLLEIVDDVCVPVDDPFPGDIALFRFGRAVSHAGIVISIDPSIQMVHAFRPTHGVQIDEIGPGTGYHSRLAGYRCLRRWMEG